MAIISLCVVCSASVSPSAAKPQIRISKSQRTTAEKMRAECAVVGKKGSNCGVKIFRYDTRFYSGPKALNVKAQGNALGSLGEWIESPERAKCLRLLFRPFRAFQASAGRFLGRCPRLSHCAALRLNCSLQTDMNHGTEITS